MDAYTTEREISALKREMAELKEQVRKLSKTIENLSSDADAAVRKLKRRVADLET